jgi:hypothetical protein
MPMLSASFGQSDQSDSSAFTIFLLVSYTFFTLFAQYWGLIPWVFWDPPHHGVCAPMSGEPLRCFHDEKFL